MYRIIHLINKMFFNDIAQYMELKKNLDFDMHALVWRRLTFWILFFKGGILTIWEIP
jgi:hypothetical protein